MRKIENKYVINKLQILFEDLVKYHYYFFTVWPICTHVHKTQKTADAAEDRDVGAMCKPPNQWL